MNETNNNSLPQREGWGGSSFPLREGRGGSEGCVGSLLCILGPSGAGKDTAAQILSQLTNIPVLVSFTTCPIRPDQKQGREHHFVPSFNAPKDILLAYTKYGGYEYWTTTTQINSKAIYVIDEEGLRTLRENHPEIRVTTIYITASRIVRRQRGVTVDRMQRDDLREQFPLDFYDYRIYNNKGKEELMRKLIYIAENLKDNDKVK